MSPSTNGHPEAWRPCLGMREERGEAVLPYCGEKEAWPSTRPHGHWKSHTHGHTHRYLQVRVTRRCVQAENTRHPQPREQPRT